LKDLDPLTLFTREPGAGAGEPGTSYILSFGSREPRSREPAIKIDGSETLVEIIDWKFLFLNNF
jgi:hypothetical protein